MRKTVVITLTGHDRVGLVEQVTGILLRFDGNVESSRMARLGGEFAMLALISLPEKQLPLLEAGLLELVTQGFKVTSSPTSSSSQSELTDELFYQIDVKGADHEGIIHQVAQHLRKYGINIETADTDVIKAPMSGTPFFNMTASIAVPHDVGNTNWISDLDDVAHQLDVDIQITRIKNL